MTDIKENGVYNVTEVAQILGQNRQVILRRFKSGDLLGRKIGKQWYMLGSRLILLLKGEQNTKK